MAGVKKAGRPAKKTETAAAQNKNDFARRVKAKAAERALSMRELAKVAGVGPQTLTGYLSRGKVPYANTLSKMAEALGVTMDWLWSGKGSEVSGGAGAPLVLDGKDLIITLSMRK